MISSPTKATLRAIDLTSRIQVADVLRSQNINMEISTSDPTPSESTDEICKLCLEKPVKYTCPRCNIRYCSSDCYKCQAHAQCSETFYRGCFMEGLKDMQPEGREKVLEMLQRNQAEEFAPEADEDLAERLEGLDLDEDTELIWQQLSKTEKGEFERMLQKGQLGNMIELWKPWWTEQRVVEEVDGDGSDPRPLVHHKIPDITSLLRNTEPSANMKYNVINVLYGYVYICRLYNGEHQAMAEDSARSFLTLSQALGKRNYESTSDALHSCFSVIADDKNELRISRDYSVAVMEDLRLVLTHSDAQTVLRVLSDAHCIFRNAKKVLDKRLKKGESVDSNTRSDKQMYFGVCKKLEFLLSWAVQYRASLSELLGELEEEICTASTDLALAAVSVPKAKASKLKSPLIEEIN